jgi:hypothetical protein
VLCVGVHVILANRLFHGLDLAVAKALSPTFTRQVVALLADLMKCQPDDVGLFIGQVAERCTVQ